MKSILNKTKEKINNFLSKDNKKSIKKKLKRLFRKENLVKLVILFVSILLIATSILPYLLIR